MAGSNQLYSIRLTDKAKEDLWREIDFLNLERDGLGEDFFDDLDQTLERLRQNPFLYAELILFVRRGLLKKFKFQVFYAVDEVNMEVEVIGILHQKQDPKIILDRLNIEF